MYYSDNKTPLLLELGALGGVVLAVGLLGLASRRVTRSRGRNLVAHVLYIAMVLACFFLIPVDMKDIIFSPLAVVVIGTVYPVYESLRAICTIDDRDDATWLTYWIAQGIVSFSTEWIDGLGQNVSSTWDMFEFFFYMWMIFPQTDGASLLFDIIFKPIITPLIQPDGIVAKIVITVTNLAHIGFVWVAFIFLPAYLKRAIWILLATVYPLGSSIISVTTTEAADDTFWLTYWSCFGTLFLTAVFVENFLGNIPGFYSICIVLTVYLMLPLFRGAEQIFRNIIVPLAGLQELLVRKDAEKVKNDALKSLPPERRAVVMKEIAKSFEKGATTAPSLNKAALKDSKASKVPLSSGDYTQMV